MRIAVAALLLFCGSSMANELDQPRPTVAVPMSSAIRMAQNSDCDQARNLATVCYRNWKNIGGGSSGQAGSFQQCMQQYCILLAAHACDTPAFCN